MELIIVCQKYDISIKKCVILAMIFLKLSYIRSHYYILWDFFYFTLIQVMIGKLYLIGLS